MAIRAWRGMKASFEIGTMTEDAGVGHIPRRLMARCRSIGTAPRHRMGCKCHVAIFAAGNEIPYRDIELRFTPRRRVCVTGLASNQITLRRRTVQRRVSKGNWMGGRNGTVAKGVIETAEGRRSGWGCMAEAADICISLICIRMGSQRAS